MNNIENSQAKIEKNFGCQLQQNSYVFIRTIHTCHSILPVVFTSDEKCSLTIDKALPEDEGHYTCRAENAHGKAECSCMVTVDGKCLVS